MNVVSPELSSPSVQKHLEAIAEEFIARIECVEIPMTLECNLRCKYCYIRDNTYKTKPVTLEQVVNLYEPIREFFPKMLKPGQQCAIIPWGSEPLLNWPVIEQALVTVFENYPGVPVYTLWSTNGTVISKSYADFVRTYASKIRSIQVSLDGPKDVHDFCRVTEQGIGSFAKVMAHLEFMRQEVPNFDSLVLYKSTLLPVQLELHHVYKATIFFHEELGVRVCPVSLVRDAYYTKESIKALDEDLTRLKDYYADHPDKTLGLFVSFQRDNTCSAARTEVGVDLSGDVYICHTACTDDTKKTYFHLGNVYTKTINYKGIYRNVFLKYNYDVIRSAWCRNCPVYSFKPSHCWMCPMDLHTLERFPYIVNTTLCEAIKVIYKHYVEWGYRYVDSGEDPRKHYKPEDVPNS